MIENKNGCLYLVATPIGNLEDMTYRGVRILNEVDLIAAEDTRNTRKLLSHYDIHTALTSYHEHNKFEKGPQLITKLQEGLNIAVVSDAGLPGIADPGTHLAQLAIQEGIKVTPIPGANAMMLLAERSRYTCTPSTTLCRMGDSCRHSRPHLVESTTLSRSMCFMASPTTSSLWYSP